MAIGQAVARAWDTEGPIPGAFTLLLGNFDLAANGYVAEEYFISGTATSFQRTASGVEPADTAEYRSRLVVCRPADTARFSGTVVVEWFNVSGGGDGCPDWAFLHRQIMRTGAAFVGVSAQEVGIEGGGFFPGGVGIRQADPARYESLRHPGDAFSYDIYSHAGAAIRDTKTGLLGGAEARRLIAVGESQSAAFLVTYVNDVDPIARVYDAFLVHGRMATGAGLEGDLMSRMRGVGLEGEVDRDKIMKALASQPGEPIREARVPVITVQSETDVNGGGIRARCHDGAMTRLWEIAGAAHFDSYGLIAAHSDDGALSPERLAELAAPTDEPLGLKSEEMVNSGPQQHYVLQAAIAHLERWTDPTSAAPHAPVLSTNDDGTFEYDGHRNVLGGVRSPWVDVPTAELSGLGAKGGGFTMLFGVTRPFDATKLNALYPGGRDDYLTKFEAATEQARHAGFLLDADVAEIVAVAKAAYRE